MDFQFEYFSSITQKKVDWLWYPYIPYGKLTILQGAPGEGKSTFMLNIAARLTAGHSMPDGYKVKSAQNVIYQTAEDNLADTVKPRLLLAGADCGRIAYIVDDDAPLTLEDNRIEKIIQHTHARLFILDPLQAYLSQDFDLLSVGRMRRQLKNLADIAAKYSCAIVIIGHMSKANGEKNLYRGLGSIDIAAIARSVLMISQDKGDASVRYMFPVKSSLAPKGAALSFVIDDKQGIVWRGTQTVNQAVYLSNLSAETKKELASRITLDMLRQQDAHSTDIINKLKLMGVSERTIHTAKKELGIGSYRKNGAWYWHLPDTYHEILNEKPERQHV